MPLLARHEGEWAGMYTVIDNEGSILDKYESHISCQFPEDGSYPYYQINRYQWPDGKHEEHHFPGTYQEKKLWFDTERLQGYAWEADDSTVLFRFAPKAMPDIYINEIIMLSPCNNYRSRTWHSFKNHRIFKRTLVQEERVG
jgi:hypothetical protein